MQLIRINGPRALGVAWLHAAASAPHAAHGLAIDAWVAQHGSQSGITNTAFTAWLPPGAGFAGLSGQIFRHPAETMLRQALPHSTCFLSRGSSRPMFPTPFSSWPPMRPGT